MTHIAVTLSLSMALPPHLRADEAVPFVIGFERFARHDEVDLASAGKLLLTELSCTACHPAANEILSSKGGPSLAGAGIRMQPSWIRRFLESPTLVHSTSTMPDMLASLPDSQRSSSAEAITAYLMTLVEPFPEPKASGANPIPLEFHERGDEQQGKRLYHTVGCVACHEPAADYEVAQVQSSDLDKLLETLDPEELQELGLSSSARKVDSIPLPKLSEKYTRRSLTYFLMYPEHVRLAGRMPSFQLKPVEAADIASYLIPKVDNRPASAAANRSPQLVAQGKALFAELRCASCHQVAGKLPTKPQLPTSKPLANLRPELPSSCLTVAQSNSVKLKRGQPRYRLDDAQLTALREALAQKSRATAKRDYAMLDLQLQLMQMNCYACHQRERLGGVDRYRKPYFETVNNVDIGDEGRLPPTLTGVGRRLKAAWMEKVLSGEGTLRPHMTIRMPVYNKNLVSALPAVFESLDRSERSEKPEAFVQGDKRVLVEAGRQLMDAGCVQCHSFRGHALPGVIGVDLSEVTTRVRPQWLHDFLLDPGALKARTRMPTFFPEGKSQSTDILSGDIELQLAAMAAYLGDLKNHPLPQKIEEARAQSFELSPTDRPILLRTFMPVGGLFSIAVGFPEKRHFTFDAERCSLAEAWQGKFLDAESTWFDRFAKPVQPLGNSVVTFPAGTAVATLANKNAAWPASAQATQVRFGGYELDSAGMPTFRYQVAGFQVTDRIQPQAVDGQVVGLRRVVTARDPAAPAATDDAAAKGAARPQLWFRALADKNPQQMSNRPAGSRAALVSSSGVAVILISNSPIGEVRNIAGQTEWIIPLEFDNEQKATLELSYLWK